MGKKKELSEIYRSNIVLLSSQDYTSRQFAARFKIAQSTVPTKLPRHAKTGNFQSRQRKGRPSLSTDVPKEQ